MRFLSNIKIPLLMVLTICALCIITSCKNTSEKELRETIEKTLDDTTVTVTTDDNWPSELPVFIPQFTYGTITKVNKQETEEALSWEIIFKDASEASLKDYEKRLKDNGFNILIMTSVDIGLLLTAEKENTNIMVTTGYGSATVTVAIKK